LLLRCRRQSLRETIGAKDRAFMTAHAEQEALRAQVFFAVYLYWLFQMSYFRNHPFQLILGSSM